MALSQSTGCTRVYATGVVCVCVCVYVQLLTPEEMCDARIDELSMMTYLSQFPNAKLNQDVANAGSPASLRHVHQRRSQDFVLDACPSERV